MATSDQTGGEERGTDPRNGTSHNGGRRAAASALETAAVFVEQVRGQAQKLIDGYEQWAAGPQGRAVTKTLDEIHRSAQAAERWVNHTADRVRTWAVTPEGRNVLEGVDVLLVAREVGDFYERAGIYRPLDAAFMREVLEQIEANAPHDLRRTLDSVAPDSEAWGWIREGLEASPSLSRWRPQLIEALDCMDMDKPKWHAAVSTLLPIVEGVIADKSGVLDGMRVGRRLEQMGSDDEGTPEDLIVGMVSYPALKVIDAEVFAKRNFATIAPDDPDLNRHTILHGVTGGYGNRDNAVRVLMIVVALAELFDGPLALRAPSHQTTDATLMTDFGPIARMRRRRGEVADAG